MLRPFAIVVALLSALVVLSTASAADFAGVWVSVPQKESRERIKIEIRKAEGKWLLHAWALTGADFKDLGETSLALLGDSTFCPDCVAEPKTVSSTVSQTAADDSDLPYGFAKLEYQFKNSYLTLRRDGDTIAVEDFNIFKDDSGRPNYRLKYQMKMEK